MRHPVTDMSENLTWTRSGTVWATFRIRGLAYGRRPQKDKVAVKNLHRALIRAIKGEAVLSGMSVSLDPAEVVNAQIAGVNLEMCPMWAEEALENLTRLDELPLGQRVFYVSVPLANPGRSAWTGPGRAALSRIQDAAGLPRTRPSDLDIEMRRQQSQRIKEAIPAMFDPQEISVAEQVWMFSRHQSRGLLSFMPEREVELAELVTTSGVCLPEPILDEGCVSELESRREYNPLKRRVMKVTNVNAADLDESQPSYQALLVMSSTPVAGVVFPGSELLDRIDGLGPEVDWAIRVKINSRDAVMKANRKAVRELNDQYSQRDNEATLGSHDLDAAADLLREYEQIFASDRLEVEVAHTIILAVGADSFEAADTQAAQVQRLLNADDFEFQRPIGDQESLWWAMHPGVAGGPIVQAYAHPTTSDKFAMLVPFTTTRLGGSKGPVAALNTTNQRLSVVHIDPAGYPELDKSGAVVAVGELGSGKSFFLKTMSAHLVSCGANLFVIDKDSGGEWAHFVQALVPDAVIVSSEDPKWSMDPLRILPNAGDAAGVAHAFFTTLLNVSPREADGVTLGQVLDAEYLASHELGSSEALMRYLETECELEGAKDLGTQMRNYARTALGRLVFDASLPPVPHDADAVVWRTHTMDQPTAEEISHAHLFRTLSLTKVFGRAYYRLLTSTARRWCFADRSRASVFVTDEAYDINMNPDNALDLEHFVRQGRRPKAILLTGSHDPERDFGNETTRKLIPTRIVMRHTDEDLARSSIRFLGVPEDDPMFEQLVEILRTDTSPVDGDSSGGVHADRRGECFIRDAFGTIGDARILGPAQPHLAAAVTSTPPKSKTVI